MTVNTHPVMDKSSPWHPAGAKRVDAKDGREQQGQNQAAISTVTKVRWHWNETLGISEGYDLWMGTSWVHFPGPEWRLEEAINPPLKSKADYQPVMWQVTWNRPNGRPSIIDLKENEMQPDTSILDEALGRTKDEPAEHIPTPPDKRPKVANGAAPFIRNHFKLHYNVEGQALNEFLKKVYMGLEPEQYIRGNGVDAAYRVMDTYDAGQTQNNPNEAASETIGKSEPTEPAKPDAAIPDEKLRSEPTKPEATAEPEKALTVIKPAQVEVIRDTAFTGRALLPTEAEWRTMGELAMTGFKSGLVKGIGNADAAKFLVETGRELGIPPSLALRKIHLIHGQPSMAAELMWAMVLNSGKLEDFEIVEADDHCTVTVHRKGAKKPYTTTFSLDMARKIATKEDNKTIVLADKYNWKAMPGVMCKWRALSAACRTIFPDVTLGLYSREEMEDAIDFTVDPDSLKQVANA